MTEAKTKDILYRINQHESHGILSHYTVTPIRVVRRGILPGCTSESITAIDTTDGHKFQGNPDNYYVTEVAAWDAIRSELIDAVAHREQKIKDMQAELRAWKLILRGLYAKC